MNRELCIVRLFTAFVIASAMHPLEVSAQSCVSQGPRYLLTSDTVYWSVQLASGKSCVRGLRFSNVLLEKVNLIDSAKSGKVDLIGPGFRYTANPGFHGEDSFSVGVLGTANKTRGSSTIRVAVAVIDIHAMSPAPTSRPTPIPMGSLVSNFNCSGFAASGSCGVYFPNGSGSGPFGVIGSTNGSTPALSGSQVEIIVPNANHNALNLNWQTQVNVQQFSTTFTFIPGGWNIAFVLNNNQISNGFGGLGSQFTQGAGCEGSFFQGFSPAPSPANNTFALQLDQYSSLVGGGSTFTYSSVQYYNTGVYASNAPNPPGQSPCNPNLGGTNFTYAGVNKVPTYPVPLNKPVNAKNTTTGDTYSVTITYDGSNLTISMYDVTLGGSCPGASCFTYTWTNVNIPAIVGGPWAWVGLASATGSEPILATPVYINSWSYSGLARSAPVSWQ
jgi:hypothetical protein